MRWPACSGVAPCITASIIRNCRLRRDDGVIASENGILKSRGLEWRQNTPLDGTVGPGRHVVSVRILLVRLDGWQVMYVLEPRGMKPIHAARGFGVEVRLERELNALRADDALGNPLHMVLRIVLEGVEQPGAFGESVLQVTDQKPAIALPFSSGQDVITEEDPFTRRRLKLLLKLSLGWLRPVGDPCTERYNRSVPLPLAMSTMPSAVAIHNLDVVSMAPTPHGQRPPTWRETRLFEQSLCPFNNLAHTTLRNAICIWTIGSRCVVRKPQVECGSDELRCAVRVEPLHWCAPEELPQRVGVVIGSLISLRESANVFCAAVVHDSRETFTVQAPTFVGIRQKRVATYLRPKLCRWWRQLAAAWPPLHLDLGADVAITVLAPMSHEVPEASRIGSQLWLLLLELLQVAWIGALRVSLWLYWPWPLYCRRKRCNFLLLRAQRASGTCRTRRSWRRRSTSGSISAATAG